ncbi:hypothetical protein AWC19_09880 [Mycobacterium palustre]|uniref:Uncharacterized protein n=1 Tax=Mycobacterium palustre TaxID=153971 RepID=A0A1X1ZM23_9MYCO|nr:hypothetical protein AWC19_09880 [Mycobacterium palustre]
MHHGACVGVAEILAQFVDQVDPLLKVEPLFAAQSASILTRQVIDLVVVYLRQFPVADHEFDLAGDQLVECPGEVAGGLQNLLLVAQ